MNKITCLSKKLKEFFNEKADKISYNKVYKKKEKAIVRKSHGLG